MPIDPIIPVAIHEAIDNAHVRIRIVWVAICRSLFHLHFAGIEKLYGVRGDPERLDPLGESGQLLGLRLGFEP